jgi:UDP-N-acetylglucosamine--N-acetylmuramyl-(pentapeptide) pyrophosphoryl-undecaprenol N-acetylglucosamine transferase
MRLLIAGGGTGGHLFPGVAIAEELRARDPSAEIQFVGTARGIEARVLPDLGWKLALIEVSGLKTVGALGAIRGLFRLPKALLQARRVVRTFKPDAVIGVGGYASGPVVLMARLAGIPTAICEQNSIPGLTNKILGRLVRAVFLSFAESKRFFKATKIVMSGNPVRLDLLKRLQAVTSTVNPTTTILVSGGSLGAVAVNELASVALSSLAKTTSLQIIHQTGEKDLEKTKQRYADAGITAERRARMRTGSAPAAGPGEVGGQAGGGTAGECEQGRLVAEPPLRA